jgi:hypothetical protein
MNMTTKKQRATEALARGDERFAAMCKKHGETEHYTKGGGRCAECAVEYSMQTYAKRMATPEGREGRRQHQRRVRSTPEGRDAINAYMSSYNQKRKAVDPAYVGANKERISASQWQKKTGAKSMPASYATEQNAIRRLFAECPKGYHVDHLTPTLARSHRRKHVATGLHCIANLRAVSRLWNLKKGAYFDPDNLRDQRPANAFPGGAWDPELTQKEWSLVQLLVLRYGEDREASVQTIQAQIARQHQTYLAATDEHA